MANSKQQLFSSITGFEASYEACGAEAEDWEKIDTLDDLEKYICYELIDDELTSSDKKETLEAIKKYRDCETGCGSDLDAIFNALEDE